MTCLHLLLQLQDLALESNFKQLNCSPAVVTDLLLCALHDHLLHILSVVLGQSLRLRYLLLKRVLKAIEHFLHTVNVCLLLQLFIQLLYVLICSSFEAFEHLHCDQCTRRLLLEAALWSTETLLLFRSNLLAQVEDGIFR